MLLVLVASVVATLALGFAFALGLRLLGYGGGGQIVERNPVVFSAVAGSIVYGILFGAIYLRILKRRNLPWSAIGFRRPPLLPLLLAPIIILGQLGAVAAINVLVLTLTGQFENPQIEAIGGGGDFSWLNFWLMLLLAGGVAPVVEEVMFRGLLYGWLRSRMPVALAVVVSAALFSVAHVIPVLLPALFVVGLTLAVAYELSGSLWIAILLHSLQNSLAVIAIFAALAMDAPLTP